MSTSRIDYGVLLVSFTLLLNGCAAERPPVPESAPVGAIVKDIGSVVITTAPGIAPAGIERLAEVDGVSALRRVVETKVERIGKLVLHSPRTLNVEIVRFRLRSGAVFFWTGILSGVDYLDVNVTVHEGDAIVRQYATGAATGIHVSQSQRYERLLAKVAERVAEEL